MTRTLEQIAADLREAAAQLKAWEDVRKAAISELEQLHETGAAPDKFAIDGVNYSRLAGRITYDYSAAPDVIATQERLRDAQEAAKALGLAQPKEGAASWRVSPPKA